MRNRITYLFIAATVFFIACSDNQVKESSQMYEASELAELMRNMHDSMSVWKAGIEQTEGYQATYPIVFNKINSATATTPSEINDAFYGYAAHYLNSVTEFTQASEEQKVARYNAIVSSCVSCHKSYCQGPIPKIEKLQITK